MSGRISRRGLIAGGLALSGCGASLRHFPFDTSHTISTHLGLEITFYSVCCVQIRSAVGSVLCDPFFTHLPFHQVAFGKCVPEPSAIAQFIPEFSDIRATLVGHNHYDHNMALPAVDPHIAPDAVHLGSQTMAHTFAANALQHELIALNNHVASPEHMGTWWVHPSGQFRVLPILSGHPSQYLFVHLFTKKLCIPLWKPMALQLKSWFVVILPPACPTSGQPPFLLWIDKFVSAPPKNFMLLLL